MPNFLTRGAIGLLGFVYFTKKWQVFLIHIVATWLSDLFINNATYAQYHPKFTWFYEEFYWQYVSYLVIALAALLILRN